MCGLAAIRDGSIRLNPPVREFFTRREYGRGNAANKMHASILKAAKVQEQTVSEPFGLLGNQPRVNVSLAAFVSSRDTTPPINSGKDRRN